jgi:hypothetical protein
VPIAYAGTLLGELVDERAGEDEVEELAQTQDRGLRGSLPRDPQKIVNTDGRDERAVPIGELGAAAAAAASAVGVWTSSGRLRGTMRIGSPCAG